MQHTDFKVTGLTCDHCVNAVTEEVGAIPGVRTVVVELVPGGASTVTVTSDNAPDPALVSAALDEAGDYQLA